MSKINYYLFKIIKKPHFYNYLEYKIRFGFSKSIKKPMTFSQKIYYLRDNYNLDSFASKVVDKYRVREYIKGLGLEHILNDLIGVFNSPKEINYDHLPNSFVIKTNHACATNIIVKDKNDLNIRETNKKLKKWMKKNYAYAVGEMQYKEIIPKIIIEKYLYDHNDVNNDLKDYQIWCFNGKPEFINTHIYNNYGEKKVIQRFSFDLQFNSNDIIENSEMIQAKIQKPQSLNKMIEYSKIISKPFKFARIDFYDIDNKPIFGEITLTPSGGNNHYISSNYQLYLGDKIKLDGEAFGKSS